MTSRSRNNNVPPPDWDPMRDDYENSLYDSQIPGDDSSRGVQLDHCKLYIKNIPTGLNEEGLRAALSKYGTLIQCYISSDPKKRYGLVRFETPGEAKLAMTKLNRTEPLNLHIFIAHKTDSRVASSRTQDSARRVVYPSANIRSPDVSDNASLCSRGNSNTMTRSTMNGDDTFFNVKESNDAVSVMDPDLELEMERLRLKEAQIRYQQRLRSFERASQFNQMVPAPAAMGGRRLMPDGKVVTRSDDRSSFDTSEKSLHDESSIAGAGDSTVTSCYSARMKAHRRDSTDGSSTPSTCVLCSEDRTQTNSKTDKSDITKDHSRSHITCELKYSDLFEVDINKDETDRLIKLRSVDYLDIVDDDLKIVIVLAGYPKLKMQLRHMELFRVCLGQVMDMQLKAGLVKEMPVFFDYYLNRGGIVFICKDRNTRDWMLRISPGLQERMETQLKLLKSRVKRLCLAILKIPKSSWPATAQDAFKLLQYFNPTLKTDLWRIYSQVNEDDVETTSFIIDRVSGEIIRGPSFKNVIDYNQMGFEMNGFAEIYFDPIVINADDVTSISSRVKLLEDIRSSETTPRASQADVTSKGEKSNENDSTPDDSDPPLETFNDNLTTVKDNIKSSLQKNVLKKLKDVEYIGDNKEILVWSDNDRDHEPSTTEDDNVASTADITASDKTDSILGSSENLICRNNNLNIDSNRGIAYHRRTNYLHVENELKLAITLEGYPQNKLEGTHIRRLKHLFKEYLHKEMKQQRFANLIIPKFQDIYLSNGAVIYICDSLETKDYLMEVMPKFINSTGLKLEFRDIKTLVRYTRIVMRIPKEFAHVESLEILSKLQLSYPNLKPDCWKYYSDVAGKQKRQFGVDPISLEVIKSPDFDPVYEGEKLSFRIIDRQKRDVSFDGSRNEQDINEPDDKAVKLRELALKSMYMPIDSEITNAPLTRIRTNHYSDLIADDLKLYVGPSDYPESRVDEVLFHNVKRTFENVVCDALEKDNISEDSLPRFHDMYLFDGVIFIICANFPSRYWVDQALPIVNSNLGTNLKSTEFRGAVGIISMFVKTDWDTAKVIATLQKQNPRLRTNYWRQISTVRTKTKLDVVLQIDKLSAQVITSPGFNKFIGANAVQFKLGHLQSLLKPKSSLEELTRLHAKRIAKKASQQKDLIKVTMQGPNKNFETIKRDLKRNFPFMKTEVWNLITSEEKSNTTIIDAEIDPSSIEYIEKQDYKLNVGNDIVYFYTDLKKGDNEYVNYDSPRTENETGLPVINNQVRKVTLKLPATLNKNNDDINAIFDVLEDNNPGLNTELWQICKNDSNKGCYTLLVDKKSASIIRGKDFDAAIAGEKVEFVF